MSAADRAVALAQANERLQYVLWAVVLILAAIWCSRYALLWRANRRQQELLAAQKAEAARRIRAAQSELARQRIDFINRTTIYLPRDTALSGRTVTSIRREKAALN